MWYKRKNCQGLKKNFFLFVVVALSIQCHSQINESINSSVYEYLYRMAQKGFIKWNDYQLPLDRKAILAAIQQLSDSVNHLTKIETAELDFYKQEYSFDNADSSSKEKVLFGKDVSNRFRVARFDKGQAKLFVDPVVGFQVLQTNHGNGVQYFSGVRLAGYFGKRWGFNFSFRDNSEKGDTLIHRSSFSPAEGIVPTIQRPRLINYSNINYDIGYRWSNGSLSVGQESFSWGYGLGGNIALSGRVPSFPFVKFEFSPWEWFHFNYFHGWLQSDIIDSARSYNTGAGIYGSRREVYFPKFIAHHSITISPFKGLDVSVGESMVYSDKLNFAYLIPINFFKIYDQYNSRYNIKAGDNSQFFGFISSRNHLKNTHLYAQVFIDEIRASKVFNKRERRNQLGYTLGISRTDLFFHYLTAGVEYSRINPFVYNNLIPAQTYQSHSYSLGDWMGNNADRLYLFAQYVPLPKLRFKLWHQKIRKGPGGTIEQQYYEAPQPGFLFEKIFDYNETGLSARYGLINKLVLLLEANDVHTKYTDASSINQKGLRFGFTHGL